MRDNNVTDTLFYNEIPSMSESENRNGQLDESLDFITRTNLGIKKHKVCVIRDCFIIGTEPICWLSTE